jgi:hypothetical protein
MGLFSKKKKARDSIDLSGVAVSTIIDSDEFIEIGGPRHAYRVVRFTMAYLEGHEKFKYHTHEAMAVRNDDPKEYKAFLTIKDRVIVEGVVTMFIIDENFPNYNSRG